MNHHHSELAKAWVIRHVLTYIVGMNHHHSELAKAWVIRHVLTYIVGMNHHHSELAKAWPIFSILEDSFVQSLKLVCVFGSSGNEAIVVTNEDELFGMGSNTNGCLGLGSVKGSFEPYRIGELCGKGNISSTSYIQIMSKGGVLEGFVTPDL